MKNKTSTTPKSELKSDLPPTEQESVQKNVQKKSGFFGDLAIFRFFQDVKEGDLDKFDVTTSSGFLKELLTRIRKVDVTGLGSQLAFFFLLSLFPLLIFLFTLLPYLNLNQSEIFLFIRDYAPENVALLIESTVGEILESRNTGLLSVGAVATVWSASKGMNALTKALNRSYFKEETRSYFVARGMSVLFTVMLITALVIALVLPVFGQQIGIFAFSYMGLEERFLYWWNSLRWIIPPFLIFCVFTILYWLVPNLRLHFTSVLPGAAFATFGWILTSFAFSFYVGNFGNYSSTYGSIGAIIVLMMWLYFSGIILMLGGQINAVISERKQVLLAKKKSDVV